MRNSSVLIYRAAFFFNHDTTRFMTNLSSCYHRIPLRESSFALSFFLLFLLLSIQFILIMALIKRTMARICENHFFRREGRLGISVLWVAELMTLSDSREAFFFFFGFLDIVLEFCFGFFCLIRERLAHTKPLSSRTYYLQQHMFIISPKYLDPDPQRAERVCVRGGLFQTKNIYPVPAHRLEVENA